jgi:hypothetical protein
MVTTISMSGSPRSEYSGRFALKSDDWLRARFEASLPNERHLRFEILTECHQRAFLEDELRQRRATGQPVREERPVPAPPHMQCDRCHGRRWVELGGGQRGVCFRCRGKGYQNEMDRRRNSFYDQNNGRTHSGR